MRTPTSVRERGLKEMRCRYHETGLVVKAMAPPLPCVFAVRVAAEAPPLPCVFSVRVAAKAPPFAPVVLPRQRRDDRPGRLQEVRPPTRGPALRATNGRADRACNHLFSSAVAREERSNEDDLAIAQPKRWHVGRVASGSTVSLVRRAVSTVRVAIIDCRQ